MGYESIAHEAEGKIQLVGQKNIETKHLLLVKVVPYSFLTARELVSKSRDGASFKKSTRKSRVTSRAWSSRNCMTSQRCKRRKHELPFLMFPSVKFCESLHS